MRLAILAITRRGADLARKLGEEAGAENVWLPEKFRVGDACRYTSEPVTELLPRLFAEVDGLVCVMAAGIVVRLLAPHLRGKERDPAVVVVDEAGQYAISLLSGHLGGANELADEVAELLGGQAVITTATDVNQLPSWDDVARQLDYRVEPTAHIKILNGLLLEERPIALIDRDGRVAARFAGVPGVRCFGNFAEAGSAGVDGTVIVSHRYLPHLDRQTTLLALRPKSLVLGIGCNRGTPVAEIEEVAQAELKHAFLAFGSVALVASIDAKRDEAGLVMFARRHRFPLEFHSREALNAVAAPSPPSAHALLAVGAQGVCEPAALLSARGGPLLVKKKKRGNVTVAVAEMSKLESSQTAEGAG